MLNIGSAYAPLIDFNLVFFAQIFNTLILFGFLTWKLYRPVTKMLENRKERIAKTYENADAALEEAHKLKAEYELKVKEIKEERAKIMEEARELAKKRADDIIRRSEEDVRILKEKAEMEIEADKKRALSEVKDDIAAMAVLAAAKILKKEIDEDSNRLMIKEFIEGVGDAKWDR